MKISHVRKWVLDMPFYCDRVTRHMHRAQTHGERVYAYRLEADNGMVGYCDSQTDYDTSHLLGRNPFAIMHDDRIGLNLQMGVLDLAGKAAGTPVHALLGTAVRDRCPVGWWDIDMPPADWCAEAQESLERGYSAIKLKARPWFDIIAQVEALGQVVPADYKFDIDFNGFLLNPARAEQVLRQLDQHPNVGVYESPFWCHQDLEGARLLRTRVVKPIVDHYNAAYIPADCTDGFVVYGNGTSESLAQGVLAAAHNKPFWLQLVGLGCTTAYAVHLGAVMSHAQLPYITCHELWEHDLLERRLEVQDGYIAVPDAPGLGVAIDEDVLDRYAVEPGAPTPKERYRARKRILQVSWPGHGRRRLWEFTDEGLCQRTFQQGHIPGFERGVSLEVIEDDGSPAFSNAHQRLLERGL
jgi:L-alanine-DL-glutamate epimerase-like enolase superfamily enzyme